MVKYNLKETIIWVGKPKGFYRFNPRTGKKDIYIKPYTRRQKVRDYTYSTNILKHQKFEEDWSHRSNNFPNIIGLTDEEIENYINKTESTEKGKKELREYIKHIKCLDKDDIRELSQKAYSKFHSKMMDKNYSGEFGNVNMYYKDSTIFLTSPRGGFDVLSDFGYANRLDKKNFPYDLERSGSFLRAESLPYGASISDVNDIVFIDDIYMSGEQCGRAYTELQKKIKELEIPDSQKPRVHYMAMIGNKKRISQAKNLNFNTVTIGEEHLFEQENNKYKDISAVVFPFSIPDGSRHYIARKLYRGKKRFEHRTI